MKHRSSLTVNRYLFVTWCLLGTVTALAACSPKQRFPSPPMNGENVVIPVASLPLEVPQFYSFHTNGKDVNFFVIRMRDGVLSFLDACLSCYPRKLGYRYADGYVVCRACDTSYSIYKLEKGIGGCYPIRIEGTREGDSYRIARSALDRHAAKF